MKYFILINLFIIGCGSARPESFKDPSDNTINYNDNYQKNNTNIQSQYSYQADNVEFVLSEKKINNNKLEEVPIVAMPKSAPNKFKLKQK